MMRKACEPAENRTLGLEHANGCCIVGSGGLGLYKAQDKRTLAKRTQTEVVVKENDEIGVQAPRKPNVRARTCERPCQANAGKGGRKRVS
jgi:hypothetical protein